MPYKYNSGKRGGKRALKPLGKFRKEPAAKKVDVAGVFDAKEISRLISAGKSYLDLDTQGRPVLEHGLAASTRSAYQSTWNQFLKFLNESNRDFPVGPDDLYLFCCFQQESGGESIKDTRSRCEAKITQLSVRSFVTKTHNLFHIVSPYSDV